LALDHIPYHAIMEHKAGLLVIPNYEEARTRIQENEWESRMNADKTLSEIPLTVE
jgi:hypothetical protein